MGLLCFRNLQVNFSPCPDCFSKNSTNSLGMRLVQLGVEYTQAEHWLMRPKYMHSLQLHLHEQILSSSCNFARTSIGHAVYWIMHMESHLHTTQARAHAGFEIQRVWTSNEQYLYIYCIVNTTAKYSLCGSDQKISELRDRESMRLVCFTNSVSKLQS